MGGDVRMTRIFVASDDGVAMATRRGVVWEAEVVLAGLSAQCLAFDPFRPEVLFCGTFGQGLWRSVDAGAQWERVGSGIAAGEVTAVAVSTAERSGPSGVVWAGTEPSAIYRSEDQGVHWQECPELKALPSASTWRFPPRPWTHHVRWIEPDPTIANRLFVAIELGGVMRSEDCGRSWEDRKPHARCDAHTLRTHPMAPGRVYEAAGDGYAESPDGGERWEEGDGGLLDHYLWGLAVTPADPNTIVVSASPSPRHAHDLRGRQGIWHLTQSATEQGVHTPSEEPWHGPQATLYRRQAGVLWTPVTEGLPPPRGTPAYVLATNPDEARGIYAAPLRDAVYRSDDGGRSWERLDITWPERYGSDRIRSLAVVPCS